MIVSDVTAKVLERVYSVIKSRANSDPETSYVAALNHSGLTKVAEKFGEEAIETNGQSNIYSIHFAHNNLISFYKGM